MGLWKKVKSFFKGKPREDLGTGTASFSDEDLHTILDARIREEGLTQRMRRQEIMDRGRGLSSEAAQGYREYLEGRRMAQIQRDINDHRADALRYYYMGNMSLAEDEPEKKEDDDGIKWNNE